MIKMENLIKKPISYSAIVLDDISYKTLKSMFEKEMPDGWVWIGHHMTIKLGELGKEWKYLVGEKRKIYAYNKGIDDKAFAVKIDVPQQIERMMDGPKFPHITLAVNRVGGGKPVDSNKIKLWTRDGFENNPLELTGTIQEIPK